MNPEPVNAYIYLERRIGKKYNVDLEEGVGSAIQKGASSYLKAYTTWGYAKGAFEYWAKKFRERLDEFHGEKPNS